MQCTKPLACVGGIAGLLCAAALAPNAGAAGQDAAACRIVVGQNAQVTDTPDNASMFEPVIAVSPTDPRLLVVGAFIVNGQDSVLPFYSLNGGNTWHAGQRVGEKPPISHDTGLLYSIKDGPILYGNYGVGLGNPLLRPAGNARPERDWRTWPDRVFPFENLDKPTLEQARRGPHAGTYYMFGLVGIEHNTYILRLERSANLRDWHPATVVTGAQIAAIQGTGADGGLNTVTDVPISRDGALFLPFRWFSFDKPVISHWYVRSVDGGKSFTVPKQLVTGKGVALMGNNSATHPSFAIDDSDSSFADRLYTLWYEAEPDQVKLFFSASSDDGATWSEPRPIDRFGNPGGVVRPRDMVGVLPSVAVNKYGVVVISWYRVGPSANGRQATYQRYVTASLDGGETVLPASPLASTASQSGTLGDYLQTVADRNGTFHEAWLDGRTGKREVWYAPIRVLCGTRPARARLPAAAT